MTNSFKMIINRPILQAFFMSMAVLSCAKQVSDNSQQTSSKMSTVTDKSFTAEISVRQQPSVVFKSIQDFRLWWSEDIEGNTDQLNETFLYHYKDIHLCKMKLIEAIPDKRLVYLVLENEFNFIEDKTEWVGTRLVFDITLAGDQTKIRFTHEGLVPEYACYHVCYDAWSGYINNSLYNLLTTGKGTPNPRDKDGFNAELAKKWNLKSTSH